MKTAPSSNGKYIIIKCNLHSNAYSDAYFIAWPRYVTWTIYVVILGLAGPLMFPDQISRYRPKKESNNISPPPGLEPQATQFPVSATLGVHPGGTSYSIVLKSNDNNNKQRPDYALQAYNLARVASRPSVFTVKYV